MILLFQVNSVLKSLLSDFTLDFLKVLHFLPGLLLSHFKGLLIPIWREITGRKFYQN